MVDRADGLARYAGPALPPDQPVETGRYLDALRRSKLLIALIVLPLTAVVLLVSLLLPRTYQATAKIVLESSSDPLQTRDVDYSKRDGCDARPQGRILGRPEGRNHQHRCD